MEYFRINGVVRRQLLAYATSTSMGVLWVQDGHVTGTDTGVHSGVDVNFFMRCTVRIYGVLQRPEGGNTHPAATPPSQQGWWAGAAWMLGGRLERHSSQGQPEATRNFR